jgi:hypothetical protein
LAKATNHTAIYYASFSTLPSLYFSSFQILSSAPSSRKPTAFARQVLNPREYNNIKNEVLGRYSDIFTEGVLSSIVG